jgi:hypothetical protein
VRDLAALLGQQIAVALHVAAVRLTDRAIDDLGGHRRAEDRGPLLGGRERRDAIACRCA